jgi:P4 family phage/plasmid primase-like protien
MDPKQGIDPTQSSPNLTKKPGSNTAYDPFIKSKKCTDKTKITHTRISNESDKIFGGSFHISDDTQPEFIEKYYKNVILGGKLEHLTEKQLADKGPILCDLDFRFDANVIRDRVYTDADIQKIVFEGYLETLKSMYQFDEDTAFPVFVMEKTKVNILEDKHVTKDGLHIIFGIHSNRQAQLFLRHKMIDYLSQNCQLPISNTWDQVLDEGISEGRTNWQMYGSCKPKHEAYRLTQYYEVKYDPTDGEFITERIHNIDMQTTFPRLCARYAEHYEPFERTGFIAKSGFGQKSPVGKPVNVLMNAMQNSNANQMQMQNAGQNPGTSVTNILAVRNKEQLDELLAHFLDNLSSDEYDLHEAYDYVMTLPPLFYDQGSYDKWTRVGWALKNIDYRLFIVWVAFSAQTSNFNYGEQIPDMWSRWNKPCPPRMVTKRSIMHWSKEHAPQKFKQVNENSLDYHVDQILDSALKNALAEEKETKYGGAGDYDLAKILFHMMKDRYVCSAVKANIWYIFKNHRWQENDSGTTLRLSISQELRDVFARKATKLMEAMSLLPEGDDRITAIQKRFNKAMSIYERLSKTNDKKNIMQEAKDMFYDKDFVNQLDTNPYLMCFENGVWDFEAKEFRAGRPEDYITKSTRIEYHPIQKGNAKQAKQVDEIRDFMRKLFPVDDLLQYMWEHLASILIGSSGSGDTTFHNYIGIGQNGKSALVNLLSKCLGEYKGDVPTTLVTQGRTKVGGVSPEVAELRGLRYAVMNEPTKGEVINEGPLKQLTSGGLDEIQARAPYMPQMVRFIPQFKLVVLANNLMEIKVQDHGTWRRIKVVDFMSLFTAKPAVGDKTKPYQYLLDPSIPLKFDEWKTVFMALLVEIVLKTDGKVKDCPRVQASSDAYRASQDVISEFINDKIVACEGMTLKKTQLNFEFSSWHQNTYGNKGPKAKDVHEAIDKKYGKCKTNGWANIRIRPEFEADDDNGEDEEDALNPEDICDL